MKREMTNADLRQVHVVTKHPETHKVDRRDFLRAAGAFGLAVAGISLSQGLGFHMLAQAAQVIPMRRVDVNIDPGNVVGTNNLSLGFTLSPPEWKSYLKDSARRQLVHNCNFGVVRVFDFVNEGPQPCIHWDEATKTGTFDWTNVDLLVQRIREIGADPLFCLAGFRSGAPSIPPGMMVKTDTGLPDPESFACYATEWVKHFKALGLPVHSYEIMNEPQAYFGGWNQNPVNLKRLHNYMLLFGATAASMRQQDPNARISFDYICKKSVMDYWLANGGADVDSLNFHKYDDDLVGDKTDEEVFGLVESKHFGTWPLGQSVNEARQAWFNARGKLLPLVCSENNLNSASETGTDPRIQQMAGAVWVALLLRMNILTGMQHSIYHCLSSSRSYGNKRPTSGAGFGMINSDDDHPWYPYYVQHMIGNNLAPGDPLVDAGAPSESVRSVAWIHGQDLNILLISKSPNQINVRLSGVKTQLNLRMIDSSVPWQTPEIRTGVIDPTSGIDCHGYTVALLQTPLA